MADVVQLLRLLILPLGIWLIASPWLLAGGLSAIGSRNDILCGVPACLLALPSGQRSGHPYGSWDRWVR